MSLAWFILHFYQRRWYKVWIFLYYFDVNLTHLSLHLFIGIIRWCENIEFFTSRRSLSRIIRYSNINHVFIILNKYNKYNKEYSYYYNYYKFIKSYCSDIFWFLGSKRYRVFLRIIVNRNVPNNRISVTILT